MSDESKSAAGGAVRKTEAGAKAPSAEELKVAADKKVADDKVAADKKVADDKVAADKKVADDKVKKAANDKASKIKREKEAAAKKVAEAEAEAKRGHFIAEGKCISCKKGIMEAGDRVKPEYFGNGKDGEAVFNRLVENGAIVEVK